MSTVETQTILERICEASFPYNSSNHLTGITVTLKLNYVFVLVDLHFLKVTGAETIVSYTRHAGNF
jgi:hypothetical protein